MTQERRSMISHSRDALQAYKAEDWENAVALWSLAIEEEPQNARLRLNRCQALSKQGKLDAALQDVEGALAVLIAPDGSSDGALFAKAYLRQGGVLLQLGRVHEAVAALKAGMVGGSVAAWQVMRREVLAPDGVLACHALSQMWAECIRAAEEPLPLSAREGRALKLVSPQQHLPPQRLRDTLEALFQERPWLALVARRTMVGFLGGGRQPAPVRRVSDGADWTSSAQRITPGRAACSLLRGFAYLECGLLDVAFRDSKVALAYAANTSGECCWPVAHVLHSHVLEAQTNNTQAALAMQQAQELRPEPHQTAALERLMRRIPDPHADALREGGAAALRRVLAQEEEEAKPEFLRDRPKYHYYNQWMRQRLAEAAPLALPEAVVAKMLEMDAGELDLLLQYPPAATAQAQCLLEVYDSQGAAAVEALEPPQLTWEQVKQLKGPEIVGLGLGGIAPGEQPKLLLQAPTTLSLQAATPVSAV